MKRVALLAAVIGAAATACATEGYVASSASAGPAYPPAPTVAQQAPRWQDPGFFAARVRDRMARIEARVRSDVSQGLLDTRAIDEVLQRRAQVEQALSQIGQAGVVTPPERDYVRGLVHDTASIRQRYATGVYAPYGGGPPTFTPPEFRDDWWY